MRVGFAGAGAIAEHHLGVLDQQPDVVIAAICDLDERRADAVAERTGASSHSDWEAMLAVEKLDALFVCTRCETPVFDRAARSIGMCALHRSGVSVRES